MTAAHPDWFDGVPDWRDDQQAWNAIAVTQPTGDQRQLHRAARHHNWQNASDPVQSWTQQAHDDNRATCQKNFWTQALSPSPNASRVLVTHKKLSFMPDVLKDKITHKLEDTAHLLACLRDWHTQERERFPEKPLWLGNKDQLEARHSWRAESLHDLLADLGLWHFGSVPANVDGAVLRLVYEVDDQVPLFKPDWRHAYPAFYWVAAPSDHAHGLARDLRTGQCHCHEWVTQLGELDPLAHLVDVQCLMPVASQNHYETPGAYWQALHAEIVANAARRGAP